MQLAPILFIYFLFLLFFLYNLSPPLPPVKHAHQSLTQSNQSVLTRAGAQLSHFEKEKKKKRSYLVFLWQHTVWQTPVDNVVSKPNKNKIAMITVYCHQVL